MAGASLMFLPFLVLSPACGGRRNQRTTKESLAACPQSLDHNRSLYFGYLVLTGMVPFKNLNGQKTRCCPSSNRWGWRNCISRFDPDYRLHLPATLLSRMIYSLAQDGLLPL